MSKEAINLVNPKEISVYLNKFAQNTLSPKRVQDFLCLALEKPLRRDKRYMHRLEELPNNASDWLVKEWGNTEFHKFIPDDDLSQNIYHIRDWISSSLNNEESWLNNVDPKGRPLKLLKIGSVEQALKEANKYSELQRQKNIEKADLDAAFEQECSKGDIVAVKNFGDGFKMVQILTKNGATRESVLMRHCIANSAYDEFFFDTNPESKWVFYSLRDAQNKPRITMEVDLIRKTVTQCVGKKNTAPDREFMSKIEEFLISFGFSYSQTFTQEGIVIQNGRSYTFADLPDDFEFYGTLDIRHIDDFICPNNLFIDGKLILDAQSKRLLKSCTTVSGLIEEYNMIEDNVCKLDIYRNDFDRLFSETWFKGDGNNMDRHRENAPAQIDYDSRTGRVISEKWYFKNLLHREDGPAVESWDSITGKQISQTWYIHGQKTNGPPLKGAA